MKVEVQAKVFSADGSQNGSFSKDATKDNITDADIKSVLDYLRDMMRQFYSEGGEHGFIPKDLEFTVTVDLDGVVTELSKEETERWKRVG
jgi:hypothetical protein